MAIDDMASLHRLAQTVFAAHNRPLRLILDGCQSSPLLPQRVVGSEAVCGDIEVRLLCVANSATLALKQFIGVPAELQIVTDRGGLRRICGIVTSAVSGQSDGGMATYQLVMRDALSVMEHKRNTRVWRDKNELDIIRLLVGEWQASMPSVASTFHLHIEASLTSRQFPPRRFIMQHDESDANFIRRLMQQRGIAWFFRPGLGKAADSIGHTLVLFGDSSDLHRNAAQTVRFHRDDATEQRDTITAWSGIRELVPGMVSLHSWDYKRSGSPVGMMVGSPLLADQGERGTILAARLDDYLVGAPHLGDNTRDLRDLGDARAKWHEYAAKRFTGEGSVRDLAAGEWFALEGHPEIGSHQQQDREFVVTAQAFCADNHLPVEIGARVERLFERSGWPRRMDQSISCADGMPLRYVTRFSCVRRRIPIVPPPARLVRPQLQSAIVTGPENGAVWCDDLGRVKVQFIAARMPEHSRADGAGGANIEGSGRDSAWVRVASGWAGNGPESHDQSGARLLPPVGTEVLVDFVGGHPDKPVIIGQVYNGAAPPPAFKREDGLPASRYQSGLRSREVHGGGRGNQLRLDDTPGQISAQLASDHGASELNLGYLTEARQDNSAKARGEGAELRTDHAIALRAARGILLSAWELLGGSGTKGAQLGRDAYLDLLRECGELCSSLGDYAADHGALAHDAAQQEALLDRFRQWEAGSNTASQSDPVGEPNEPVIALTSPAGIGFASSKAIVSYSATSIDSAALQNLQLTAGQRFAVNAGAGVSLFARSGGFKVIAHQGKLLLQSQHDDIAINAAKSMQLSASEGTITIAAKTILLVAEDGSFFRLGDGPPVLGSKEPLKFHGAEFLWDGPETMDAHLPVFEKAGTDLVFEPRFYPHLDGGVPAPGLGYRIDSAAGGSKGNVDDGGTTPPLKHEQMHLANIELREEGES